MKYVVTGGAGFIGSHFVRYVLQTHADAQVLNYDLLTYAGNLANLKDIENNERYTFVKGDIGDIAGLKKLFAEFKPDVVVNFAAESHNDRGEDNPLKFFETNVLGTARLMQACREAEVPRVHHISTCEVFGDLELDALEAFSETSRYAPKTPYNASKAGSDHAVMAYYHTFKVPVTISNCANNYGPYQYPEKLIPLFVTNALEGKKMPLFKSSKNKREWTHVVDHCAAVDLIVRKGRVGESYNIGSGVEKTVEEIADIILAELGLGQGYKEYVPDRLQHDKRYLLDSGKVRAELGWTPTYDFAAGMAETVAWYKENEWWWKPIKSGELYRKYYEGKYKRV